MTVGFCTALGPLSPVPKTNAPLGKTPALRAARTTSHRRAPCPSAVQLGLAATTRPATQTPPRRSMVGAYIERISANYSVHSTISVVWVGHRDMVVCHGPCQIDGKPHEGLRVDLFSCNTDLSRCTDPFRPLPKTTLDVRVNFVRPQCERLPFYETIWASSTWSIHRGAQNSTKHERL